ncbi:MAG TPA: hypothetical protein VK941_01135 [Gillisia sp.]|nr:hypothetical protein [Gillisia sp.]
MKKLFTLLFCSAFILTSCSDDGPAGPQGPQGPPGEDGINILGATYEYDVDFEYVTSANYYSAFLDFDQIEPSDGVLVYRLEVAEDSNGNPIDTWSLLPQVFFLEQGIIQYVFTHTTFDVELIIDGNFNLSNLNNGFTQNQVFRIIVVPSDPAAFASSTGVNLADMDAVLKTLNLHDKDIIRM